MSDTGNPTIDQTQRWNDIQEMVHSTGDAQQSQIWTSMPAIVKKHNDDGTIEVQPAIKQKHTKEDNQSEWMEHPPLKKVPIQYPGGGGASWTFPLKEGDEVLLCVASRNIDKWAKDGGVQEQMAPFRMHDMNDAFAIPGFRSQKRKLKDVSMDKAQLRTDDGRMVIEFDPKGKEIVIRSPDKPVRIEGDLEITGVVRTGSEIRAGREVFAHAGTNKVRMNWAKTRPLETSLRELEINPNTDPDDLLWEGVLGFEVYEESPFDPALGPQAIPGLPLPPPLTTALGRVGDLFTVAGAINQVMPQISAILNGTFTVAGLVNSLNFNALLNAIPNQMGAIIGNPIVQAIVKLSTHDHHGVRAGAEISDKPVVGT